MTNLLRRLRPLRVLRASCLLAVPAVLTAQEKIIHVDLAYRAPVDGQPRPNFSPKGEQVKLAAVSAKTKLPAGAIFPAKQGLIKVGPDKNSWIPVLATATAEHPNDLCQIFLDRNRNGNFLDDGPGLTATPAQNAKTKAWWSSVNKVELTVPYSNTKATEPYLVNFWIVREDSTAAPDILRYSVSSWRYGTTTVNGVPALVAAMDDNNAIFNKEDMWSVLPAVAPKVAPVEVKPGAPAPKAPPSQETLVLSIGEARPTNRFMFLPTDGKEMVLEFRKFSPDGRSIDFAVVDRDMTKALDRAPDDQLKDERPRPRTTAPFTWEKKIDVALAKARESGKKVIVDFATTWCGPCGEMDNWIWNDKDVAAKVSADYVGLKLDGDIEKALVKKYEIAGYPHMLVLNADGKVLQRVVGYQSSKAMLVFLGK